MKIFFRGGGMECGHRHHLELLIIVNSSPMHIHDQGYGIMPFCYICKTVNTIKTYFWGIKRDIFLTAKDMDAILFLFLGFR